MQAIRALADEDGVVPNRHRPGDLPECIDPGSLDDATCIVGGMPDELLSDEIRR